MPIDHCMEVIGGFTIVASDSKSENALQLLEISDDGTSLIVHAYSSSVVTGSYNFEFKVIE